MNRFLGRVAVTIGVFAVCLSACRERLPASTTAPPVAPAAATTSAPPPPTRAATAPPASAPTASPSASAFDPWLALPTAPPTAPFDADVVQGTAIVTSVERQATAVGLDVLAAGGNAVDAAVATALALAVTHPSAGNLGGGGFLLLKLGRTIEAIDFRENAPLALTRPEFDRMIHAHGETASAVGVPGTVAGLALAHERHGRLPWARLVDGALRLADGMTVGDRQAKVIRWARDKLRRCPAAVRSFLPGGQPPAPGARLAQPRLHLALQRIRADGPAGFYQGPTARDLVESLGPGAVVSADDLARYRAVVRTPLVIDHQGSRIITMPLPSGGGPTLVLMLSMLNQLGAAGTPPDSAQRLHLLAEAARRAQVERHLFLAPPGVWPLEQEEAARKRWTNPLTWLGPHPVDPNEKTPSKALHPLYQEVLAESEDTTHLSVVDTDGGAVSLTLTLSASFGSGIVTSETGIVLNNSVASFSSRGENQPRPGVRTLSSMAPTLVLLGERDFLVLGTPGGDTIPSTLAQLVLRLVDDRQSLAVAVRAPRIHEGFVPDEISMERTRPLPRPLVAELEQRGHRVRASRAAIGDANVAAYFAGRAGGVHDEREGGEARALGAKE